MLRESGDRRVTLLDGDVVRKHLSSELGSSREHREINLRRIGFVAGEITRNGGVAICAPIAPYATSRRELRETIEAVGGFVEVHVSTPLDTCEARDRKRAATRKGDLRRRLLLVRRVGFRQGSGRRLNSFRLHRRQDQRPDLPEGHGGRHGPYDAVEITYDPAKVGYEALLTAFWHSVDPTDGAASSATAASPTRPRFSPRTRRSAAWPRLPGKRRKKGSTNRSSPRSWPPDRSTPPKIITRTITRITRSATATTGLAAAATVE